MHVVLCIRFNLVAITQTILNSTISIILYSVIHFQKTISTYFFNALCIVIALKSQFETVKPFMQFNKTFMYSKSILPIV